MFNFINLTCPTCGATLRVKKDENRFACEHCGNDFLLEKKANDLSQTDRDHPNPVTTYTQKLNQWLKVGEYEICLRAIQEKPFKEARAFCLNVEYRNPGRETLSCRRNQWILFDADGYTYDNESYLALYEGLPGQPLGGDRMLTPGAHVRGWVAFKIPASAKVDRIQFLTGYLGTKTVEFFLK